MAFEKQDWKTALAERLQGWRERMKVAGVKSSYYFIAASTFLPIVQSYQAGNLEPLIVASSIAGGIGANLLSNIVQNWKDEATAAKALETAVAADSAILEKLDQLLTELDALQEAGRTLADEDKAWFVEAIQKELEDLNSGIKIEVDERGVYIGGNAENNIIISGNYNRVVKAGTHIEHQTIHQAPDTAKIKAAENAVAREAYLQSLYRRCQSLPLAALGDDPNAREGVKLDDVYIELHTKTPQKIQEEASKQERRMGVEGIVERDKPLPAFDAFLKTSRMVLLGDPGSGKSTFVRNLLAIQAQVLRGKRTALEGVDANLLPILVTLRDLIAHLSRLDCDNISDERRDAQLVKAIDEQIIANLSLLDRTPEFEKGLCTALQSGRVLLAFDGLDEVPEHLREKVRLAVAAYQKAYELPRVIITSRIRSYHGSAVQHGFTAFTLAPFTKGQARRFCQGWYDTQFRLGKVDADFAKEQAEDLARAAWRDELRKLAENPMLLTTMAIIHQKETRLPDQRVKLYSEAVRILIERWQKHHFGEALAVSDELAAVLKDERRVRKILERLAYEAHRVGKENGKEKEADLLRKDALDILEASAYLGSLTLASQFLDYVDLRSGLLVGRGGEPGKPSTYSFAHRTFQEYLAGCYLINQRDNDRLLLAHASEPDYWSLAVEFGSEEILFNGRTESQNDVLDLAYRLLAGKCKTTTSRRAALWSAKMAALVGAGVVRQDEIKDGAGYLERALKTTLGLLESDLTPVERADAGRVLAKLGDPRPGVMDVDALEFSLVPAGKFYLGEKDEMHQLNLPAFWMSRYPITNAQYNAFVEDGGYTAEGLWKEAKAAKVWQNGKVKGEFDHEPREAPADFGEPFNLSNHPVVGITWYEMLAFTRWLTGRWRKAGWLPDGWQVTLPSEAEWKKAARGGIQIPKEPCWQVAQSANWQMEIEGNNQIQNPIPQRTYPWGDEFGPNKANTGATGIGTTSAVGCFANGISPYGLYDLSGNVWEWGRSLLEKYPYPEGGKELAERENLAADDTTYRVLCGGDFDDLQDDVRCAARGWNKPSPHGWPYLGLGFRVVVSPILHRN